MKFLPGKRAVLVLLAVAAVLLLPLAAQAVTYGFFNISNNNAVNAAIGEAQLFVDVTAFDAQVKFHFTNSGPALSSICDIYFDDGSLLGDASSIYGGSGVSFSQGASPHNLPGGNTISPPFVTTTGCSADSDPPVQPNGVNPGEYVDILFNLKINKTFADVINDINTTALRIGIHVQDFDSGGSESFVNNPVPIPPSALLLGSGLLALGLLRYRRRQNKS